MREWIDALFAGSAWTDAAAVYVAVWCVCVVVLTLCLVLQRGVELMLYAVVVELVDCATRLGISDMRRAKLRSNLGLRVAVSDAYSEVTLSRMKEASFMPDPTRAEKERFRSSVRDLVVRELVNGPKELNGVIENVTGHVKPLKDVTAIEVAKDAKHEEAGD